MKTPPKSPQSPVKRAKRARLMWQCVGLLGVTERRRTILDTPVHVLDASEAAHEQRVSDVAAELYKDIGPASVMLHRVGKAGFARLQRFAQKQSERWARSALASVYSAPAGKGKTK